MERKFRHVLFLALIITVQVVTAQTFESADEYYEDANRLFLEEDYESSIIQLKNALQLSPQHVPTLILTGRVYLKLGLTADAEHVLSEALMQGADPVYAAPLLARSLLEQRSYEELIKDLSLDNVPQLIKPEMLGYHAHALIGLNKLNAAAEALEEALTLDPQDYTSRLAQITLALRRGYITKALARAELLISSAPDDTRSWNAYASALHATGKLESAITAYTKAVEIEARNIDARMALIITLVDLDRDAQAKPHLEFLKIHAPYDPRAAYFRGLIAARSGDTKTEREQLSLVTQVLAALPPAQVNNDPQMLMIGALAHFGLSEYEKSRDFLEGYTAVNAEDIGARRLLATVLIALREEKLAIQVLANLQRRNPQDTQVTTLLATAYDQSGQHTRAAELLLQLEGAGQGNLPSDRQLAFSLMDAGELARGTAILNKIFKKDPSASGIAFALALAHLREGRVEQAMVMTEALTQGAPKNLSYQNLHGAVEIAMGEAESATVTFQELLKTSPTYKPAQINLAKALRRQNKLKDADAILTQALEMAPDHPLLMIEKAKLLRAQGKPQDALRFAERAAGATETRLEYNYLLIDLLIQLGKLSEAEQKARQTAGNYADSLEAKSMLGQTLRSVGKPDKALLVYNRMVKQLGFDTGALYKISVLQADMGEYDAAKYSLYKALEGNSQHQPSREAYILMHLALNENEKALKHTESYIDDFPELAIGYQLQGRSYAGLNNHLSAIASYERARLIDNSNASILGLYQSHLALGNIAKAEQLVATKPNQQNANKTSIRAAHADLLIADKRWSEAKEVLIALTQDFPRAAHFLNNLAYVLDKMADDSAIEYARRAHALAPFDAMSNDTLGWILVKNGDPREGIKFLREATSRAAGNPELHYHLAVALAKLGRPQQAAIELRKALKTGDKFDGRVQATKLLAELER